MRNNEVSGIGILSLMVGMALPCSLVNAQDGNASELGHGQAPLIFSQGKLGASLRDGTIATTDEIYLWIPAIDANGDVDLGATGQFFLVWDSGSIDGVPTNFALGGNDDEDNEMRGLHFDPANGGSFLLSYDDGTTTGFVAESAIADGNLVRVSPDGPFSNGQMQDFLLVSELVEGANGTAGNMAATDLYGFAVAPDGTFYWGSGSATLATTSGGAISKGSNEFVHTEGFASPVGSPRNIGDTLFYKSNVSPDGFVFPTFINGQSRGIEVLTTGEVLISVSDTYNYPNASDTATEVLLDRWDIGLINQSTFDVDVIYPGELFFQEISTSTSEMLGFDVLDSQEELVAFQSMIGTDSDAGVALSSFVADMDECLADITGDGDLDFFDVSGFLDAFGAMNPIADMNNDGEFDFFDVSDFLAAFGAGCP